MAMNNFLAAGPSGSTILKRVGGLSTPRGGLKALIMTAAAIIAPAMLSAQSADFRGLITAIDHGTSTAEVNGTVVHVNGSTSFDSDVSGAVTFSYFQYGMNVRVRGTTQGDQSVLADRFDEKEPGSGPTGGGTDRFRGILESKDSGTGDLVVNGLTIHTTPYTAYENLSGVPITFSELPVGAIVKVGSTPLADGTRLGGEVEIEDDLGGDNLLFNLKFEGTITAINSLDQTMTVGSKLVYTDSSTRFEDVDSEPILFSTFTVGQFVEVKANTQPDDTILAVEIEQHVAEGSPTHNAELRGKVESINLGLGTLVVSGTNISTNGSTLILDQTNASTTLDQFSVGGAVEVEGLLQPDTSILATKLKMENDLNNGLADDVRLFGPIDSLDSGTNSLVVVGQTVTTNGSTTFLSGAGAPITFNDLTVSAITEVEGVLQQDGSVLATRVHLEAAGRPRAAASATLYGPITLLNVVGNQLQIRNKVVHVNGGTSFLDVFGTPVAFADLATGEYIAITGDGQPGNSILATTATRDDQFFAFPPPPPPSSVTTWSIYN
jgi:hypothetical protein